MTAAEKPWAPFDYFLGDWQGTGSGGPGESKVTRCYRLTLQGKFIQIKDQSDYPPQEKNLDGELHENLSMLSYDSGRECYVLREFHVEGFVNQYVLDVYEPGERFVFLTESIENIGPGWRAPDDL